MWSQLIWVGPASACGAEGVITRAHACMATRPWAQADVLRCVCGMVCMHAHRRTRTHARTNWRAHVRSRRPPKIRARRLDAARRLVAGGFLASHQGPRRRTAASVRRPPAARGEPAPVGRVARVGWLVGTESRAEGGRCRGAVGSPVAAGAGRRAAPPWPGMAARGSVRAPSVPSDSFERLRVMHSELPTPRRASY